jgi:hypothetical protein
MNYQCPYKERKVFCTHKRITNSNSTSNGRKYCAYKNVFKCPYFLAYYDSLTSTQKMAVNGLNPLKTVSEDKDE